MENKRSREIFLFYAEKIKELGYRVYIRDNEETFYGWVVNDKNEIGYFQLDDWHTAVVFSTVHKPTYEHGTGFGLDDHFNGHKDLSNEIIDRCFIKYPDWATGPLYMIKKMTADEYIENQRKNWKDLIEL